MDTSISVSIDNPGYIFSGPDTALKTSQVPIFSASHHPHIAARILGVFDILKQWSSMLKRQ